MRAQVKWRAWLRMCAGVGLALLAGCATAPPAGEADDVQKAAAERGSSVTSAVDTLDETDVPGAIDAAELSEAADALDGVDAADAVGELVGEPAASVDPGSGRRPRGRRDLIWTVTAVGGYRSDLRAVLEKPGVLAIGIRSCRSGAVGYVRFRGPGPVRSMHIGHLNVRMGERLLLGRSLGMYPVVSSAAVAGGLVVSPSLSSWFGRTGAAVELGGGPVSVKTLLVGTSNRLDAMRPGAVWTSLNGGTASVSAGITYGEELRDPHAASNPGVIQSSGDGTQAPGDAGRRHRYGVASLYGGYRSGGVTVSGELSRYPGAAPFLALRFAQRRRPLRWKILCYRAPYFSSTSDPRLELRAPERINQGARLDVSTAVSGVKSTLSLIDGRFTSPAERKIYRRLILTFSGRSGRLMRWKGSVYHVAESVCRYAVAELERDVEEQSARRTRGRLVVEFARNPAITHRIRVDCMTGRSGAAGVLVSAGSVLSLRRFEIRWQVSAFSLPSGTPGYLTRPGVGSFESFSSAYGGGSDVSVRLRWRPFDGVTLTAYRGTAWSKPDRVYVGLEWRD
ncbi:MAG: hypothetical protein P8181_05370 [bacterium]